MRLVSDVLVRGRGHDVCIIVSVFCDVNSCFVTLYCADAPSGYSAQGGTAVCTLLDVDNFRGL